MRQTVLPLVVSTMLTAACGDDPSAAGPLVRDSLEVRIVENGAAGWTSAETWSLEAEPVVSVGGDALTFHDVADLLLLDDGGFALLNAGSSELFVFDADGSLRFRAGREGDGPGEFRAPTSLVPLGDSVGVYDTTHRRLSVFDTHGTLRREASLAHLVSGTAWTSLIPLETAGMVLWSNAGFGSPPGDGVYRAPAEILRADPTGTREASYGDVPGTEVFVNAVGAGFVLFGKTSHGAGVGDRLVVGTAESPELRIYGPGGTLERVIRWPDEDRRITEAAVEAAVDEILELTTEEANRPQARQMFERIPRAEEKPAYDDLLASESHLWVGAYRGPAATVGGGRSPERSWLIFDTSGRFVARLVTPVGVEPADIQGDRMLAVYKDALGVETVRIHRIRR